MVKAQEEPRPDLVVEDVVFTDTELRVNVRNVGTVSSHDETWIGLIWLRADGSQANDGTGGNIRFVLLPGETSTDVFTADRSIAGFFADRYVFSPPADAVRLKIWADPPNMVPESNEGNNIIEVIRITGTTTGEDLATADEEQVAQEIEQELVDGKEGGGEEDQSSLFESGPTSIPLPEDKSIPSLSVSKFEPTILPGNPLYLFKTLNREVRAMFTLDSVKDAELRLRFANEKILEANILTDRGKNERAVKHLGSYNRELEKINEFTAKLDEKNQEAAKKFSEKIAKSELKHQILISKIEKVASLDNLDELKEIKSEVLENIAKIIDRLDDKKMEKVLSDALDNSGSPFRQLRNLEVLKAVETKVPERAKDAIEKAQENTAKKFTRQLQSLPEKHQFLLSEYVEKSGGNEVFYLKSLSRAKSVNPEIKDKILDTEKKLLKKIDEKIEKSDSQTKDFADNLDKAIKTDKNIELTVKSLRPEIIKKVSDKLNEVGQVKSGKIKPSSEKSEIDQLSTQCSDRLESLQKDMDKKYEELFSPQSLLSPLRFLASFRINQNIDALNAQRHLGLTNERLTKSMERLSSGLRTNQTSEDATGLAFSEKFDNQVRILSQAILSTNDIVLLAQEADAYLREIIDLLNRISELAVQSTDEKNTASDRISLQAEIPAIIAEIDRIATATTFNGAKILDGSFTSKLFQTEVNAKDAIPVSVDSKQADSLGIKHIASDGKIFVSKNTINHATDETQQKRKELLTQTKELTRSCEKEANEMRSILGKLKKAYKKEPGKTFSPKTTPSLTEKPTPNLTPAPTESITPTPIIKTTLTPTPVPTKLSTPTPTLSPTPTKTTSPTPTPTKEVTPTPTPTKESTPTPTPTISKPAISSFIASPTAIALKQSSTLSWETSGADSVVLNNTKETLASSGKKLVTPTSTTTYTITATNKGGSTSASATVTVK